MSDGHRLVQAMREAGRTPPNEVVDIVLGEVTSINPLKVKLENRELTKSFLVLSPFCKPLYAHIDDNQNQNTGNGIMLWRGLSAGDKVLMLKVGRGQKYYILHRE